MTHTADVIVVGLGAMGSAAALAAARRKQQVLGFDRFHPPHAMGSSHGGMRTIRQAYQEGTVYVPLVLRAYTMWRRLEQQTGIKLLTVTGGLTLGASHSGAVRGTLLSALEHHLAHEVLSKADVQKRFAPLVMPEGWTALYEPQAGLIDPQAAVGTFLKLAQQHGAALQYNEPVLEWRQVKSGGPVVVQTSRGRYEAHKLIITAGAWNARLLRLPALELRVRRMVMHWFYPQGGLAPFMAGRLPVFFWDLPDGTAFYGQPARFNDRDGVKVAFHNIYTECDPEQVDRRVSPLEGEPMRSVLQKYIPLLDGRPRRSEVCLYTQSRDGHFLLGLHPNYDGVAIGAGFSGHGFKFAPVIGEILADLTTTATLSCDTTFFKPQRVLNDTG